jgi:hypothetical protein
MTTPPLVRKLIENQTRGRCFQMIVSSKNRRCKKTVVGPKQFCTVHKEEEQQEGRQEEEGFTHQCTGKTKKGKQCKNLLLNSKTANKCHHHH